MNKALPRWAVCAFFAVFLALGLLTAADYGPSWDEQTEMDILRMNLWEYARVLGLDESRFETLAARQGPLSIETLRPISQSIEQDHGTAAFYPFGWVVLDLSLTGAQQSALWHMACWAVFTLGGFALYAALALCISCFAAPAFAADDPLAIVNNLSDFVFSLIRAVGVILLGWGVVQVGLSFQSHDPSQRSQGFLTLAGGLVITFAREILALIGVV